MKLPSLKRHFVLYCLGLPVSCGVDTDDTVPEDASERYAEAYCKKWASCNNCDTQLFDSKADCSAFIRARFEAMVTDLAYRTKFNSNCFEQQFDSIADWGCYHPQPNTASPFQPGSGCRMFSGDGEKGDECSPYWGIDYLADDCSPALICNRFSGRCVEDGPTYAKTAIGDSCNFLVEGQNYPERPESCAGLATDDHPALYCDDETLSCQPMRSLGEPCTEEDECEGGFCQGLAGGEGICAEFLSVDDICDGQDVGACPARLSSGCYDGICIPLQPLLCEREWIQ